MSKSTEAEIQRGQERLKMHESEAEKARRVTADGKKADAKREANKAANKPQEGQEPYQEPASESDKIAKEKLKAASGGGEPPTSEEPAAPQFRTEVGRHQAGQPIPEPTIPKTEPPVPKQTATPAPSPEGDPPKGTATKKAPPSLDDLLKS